MVGGWALPLWKIWVRQWEGWYPIYEMENHPNVWNHQPEKYWFSNWRVHVLILPSDVGCMNTSLKWIEIQRIDFLVSYELCILNLLGETPHWRRFAVFSIVPSILDVAQVKYSTLQNCGCSANRWFSSGAKTRKKKRCAKRNFLQGQSGAPRLQEEPIIWCCACGKAHHCNILRV